MINANESFKFYHRDEPELIYTWIPEHEQVEWEEKRVGGSTVTLSTSYPSRSVQQLVKEGTWVAVE